jgi:predicted SnoaL-like aldol condensation-catalyzing enzyme
MTKTDILTAYLDSNYGAHRIVRWLDDGDRVVAHVEHTGATPRVGLHVARLAGDRVVDHRANLGDRAPQPNASGRTQLDGPTDVTDRERTAANKALVAEFVQTVLLDQQLAKAAGFVDGYLQHNPLVGDGLAALGALLQTLATQGTPIIYDKLVGVLGEGNFVLAMSEGRFGAAPTSYFDLFRLEGGKIVEHWDVIQ